MGSSSRTVCTYGVALGSFAAQLTPNTVPDTHHLSLLMLMLRHAYTPTRCPASTTTSSSCTAETAAAWARTASDAATSHPHARGHGPGGFFDACANPGTAGETQQYLSSNGSVQALSQAAIVRGWLTPQLNSSAHLSGRHRRSACRCRCKWR